jgi:hypothetical protein
MYNGGLRTKAWTANCPTGSYGFQQKMLDFSAPSPYTKLVITITYSKAGGAIYFDGVSLLKAP